MVGEKIFFMDSWDAGGRNHARTRKKIQRPSAPGADWFGIVNNYPGNMLAKPERFWEKHTLVLVNLRKIKTMSRNPQGGSVSVFKAGQTMLVAFNTLPLPVSEMSLGGTGFSVYWQRSAKFYL